MIFFKIDEITNYTRYNLHFQKITKYTQYEYIPEFCCGFGKCNIIVSFTLCMLYPAFWCQKYAIIDYKAIIEKIPKYSNATL